MKYTCVFTDLCKEDADVAGGKGASLGEMTNADIPVPPGFVVTADTFDFFTQETDLTQEIKTILDTVDTNAIHTTEEASEKIQALILNSTIPENVAKEIKEQFTQLDSEYVAVRSSATAEDSADHAWAGQLDSFLNTTEDTLLENVKRCWASLFTPRAIFYRFEKGLHTAHISVAVVVQKMVASEKSGIAFSVHPVTEDYNQMIIEAGFGLGEAIVSGSVTPDSYVVTKDTDIVVDTNVNEQTKALYRKAEGGNEWKELGEQGKEQVLTESQVLELATIIKKIEDHYGTPQDIEWAYENEIFYITQSRPITTLSSNVITPKKKEVTETFQIFVEDFNVTPFVIHSLSVVMEDAIREFIENPPKTMLYFHDNNVRWGASVAGWDSVAPQVVEKLYSDPEYYIDFNTQMFSDIQALKKITGETYKKDIQNLSLKEIQDIYNRIMEMYMRVYARGMVPTLADMHIPALTNAAKTLLRTYAEDVEETFVQITTPEQLSEISREEMDLLTLSVNTSIHQNSPELQQHADTYFGMVFGYEGSIYTAQDVWKRIEESRKDPKSAQTHLSKLKNYTEKQMQVISDLENKLKLSDLDKKILSVVRNWLFSKEARKDVFFDTYAVMDIIAEEVAQKTNTEKRRVKFLTHTEMNTFFDNQSLPLDIEERLKHMVVTSKDNTVVVLSGIEAANYAETHIEKEQQETTDEIQGQIAFKGSVQGVVKIIQEVGDIQKMEEGNVLVSNATNPNLLPAMRKASAFVTNVGGITCHAAIVAREMQKPCIIGTKIATQVLKDGDLVEVDANEGVVRVLEGGQLQWQKVISREGVDVTTVSEVDVVAYELIAEATDRTGEQFFTYINGSEFTHYSAIDPLLLGRHAYVLYFDTPEKIKNLYTEGLVLWEEVKTISANQKKKRTKNKDIKTLLDAFRIFRKQFATINRMYSITSWFAIEAWQHDFEHMLQIIIERNDLSEDDTKKVFATVYAPWKKTALLEIQDRCAQGEGIQDIAQEYQFLRSWCAVFFRPLDTEWFKEIASVQQKDDGHVLSFEALCALLQPTDQERKELENAPYMTFFKDWRDDLRRFHVYAWSFLFDDIAELLKVSREDLGFLTLDEIEDAISGTDLTAVISERKQCGCIITQENTSPRVHALSTQKDIAPYKVYISDIEDRSKDTNIAGSVAQKGVASGRVQVIRSYHDIKKVAPGDILVANTTHLNYLPAMQRAAAFVTNEGGVISHAAIVSREMSKPCITGTKIATQVLKDGDLVEVDANEGVVRLLNRS